MDEDVEFRTFGGESIRVTHSQGEKSLTIRNFEGDIIASTYLDWNDVNRLADIFDHITGRWG